jgi:alpha-tubulin suppressor-like RCC1 family protein
MGIASIEGPALRQWHADDQEQPVRRGARHREANAMSRISIGLIALIAALAGCTSPLKPDTIAKAQEGLVAVEQQKLQVGDLAPFDRLGTSVAVSGNIAVLGDPYDDNGPNSEAGSIRAFHRDGSTWSLQAVIMAPDQGCLNFGASVAFFSDQVFVGCPEPDGGSGRGSVYILSSAGWSAVQKISAPAPGETFGARLAAQDGTLIISGNETNVYVRDGELWTFQALVPGPSTAFAIRGNTLVHVNEAEDVGSDPGQGAAHVFERSETTWTEVQTLVASDGEAHDGFGSSVGFYGDTIVVGARRDDDGAGSAYVFARLGSTWSEQMKLRSSDAAAGDEFGAAVVMLEDRLLVGAPLHEHLGHNANHGSVYFFKRLDTDTSWTEQNELLASDGQNNDFFGSALALATDSAFSGATAIIGAPNDDDVYQATGSAYAFIVRGAYGDQCTADGDCAPGMICSGGQCCSNACKASGAACEVDVDCHPTLYCSSHGFCVTRKAQGRACEPGAGADCRADGCRVCATGPCVDGFCCEAACSGGCSACARAFTGVANGTCAPVRAGTDPRDACALAPGFPASCGADGQCDGAGACRVSAPAGTTCSPATCDSSSMTDFACDAGGHCVPNVVVCGAGGTGGSGAGGSNATGGAGGTSTTGGTGGATGGTGGSGGTTGGSGGTAGSGGAGSTGTGGTGGSAGAGTGGTGGTGPCDPNPCLRGAACITLDEGHACDCPTGTYGANCEHSFTALAAGGGFVCGLGDDAQISCWGWNSNGQSEPPSGAFQAVATGNYHACGIRTDGTLACWGGLTIDSGDWAPPAGTFRALSAGHGFMCGIRTDDSLACAGYNSDGQATPPAGTFLAVSAGFTHACAIRSDSTLVCWGVDVNGLPVQPPSGTYKAIASANDFSCAIRTNGDLVCWGDGRMGETDAPSGTFRAITAGLMYACALRADGSAACWGDPADGKTTPPAGTFDSLALGNPQACGLRPDGTVDCWGAPEMAPPGRAFKTFANGCGIRGDDTFGCVVPYFEVEGPIETVTRGGGGHACALHTDQTVTCFADGYSDNRYGQMNPPCGTFEAVGVGSHHTCGLRTDGTLSCWGADYLEQSTPPAGTFRALAVFGNYSCAIRQDQTLECWGSNDLGESVAPDGTYLAVATGNEYACAIRSDGAVVCWGWDIYGQRDAPPGVFKAVATDTAGACAIRLDGTLACWGQGLGEVEEPPPGTFVAVSPGAIGSMCGLATDHTVECWGYYARSLPAPSSDACSGIDCAGNGVCVPGYSGPDCRCDSGFAQAWGDPRSCVADVCSLDWGGCDPYYTFCGNTAQGRICGPCPDGYSGNGESGCTPPPTEPCDVNPCQHGGTCLEQSGRPATCSCPPGFTGPLCELHFERLSSTRYHTCGVRADGTLLCWGNNFSSEIMPVPSGTFTAVAVSPSGTCGLRADGTITCSGTNFYGEGEPPAGEFLSIAGGEAHYLFCGIRADETLACWGSNGFGQATPPAGTFRALAVGAFRSCAIRTDDTVVCWGEAGLDPPDATFRAIGVGDQHVCGLGSDGTIVCFGADDFGQSSPPPGIFRDISVNGNGACAVDLEGALQCWGSDNGLPPNGAFQSVTLGSRHACAVAADSSVACWGVDELGPVHAPSSRDWSRAAPPCSPCPAGYEASGELGCSDVDECAVANGDCDALTTCTNTVGSRACGPCPPGYAGTGRTACVDYCATNNGGCDPLASCVSVPGGPLCGG